MPTAAIWTPSSNSITSGRDNRLAYRIARRDAHNRDAELASVVSNMSTEPKVTHEMRETAFRLLCLNHTLTSYISALGAHREKLTNPEILALLDDAVCYSRRCVPSSPRG